MSRRTKENRDARRAEREAAGTRPCPCGGGAFAACCGPHLGSGPLPGTAEATMRSRYTAHATGDVAHLVRTSTPQTRPEVLQLDPAVTWTGLEVVEAREDGDEAVVHFRASYSHDGTDDVLEEHSRFTRDGDGWTYTGAQEPAPE